MRQFRGTSGSAGSARSPSGCEDVAGEDTLPSPAVRCATAAPAVRVPRGLRRRAGLRRGERALYGAVPLLGGVARAVLISGACDQVELARRRVPIRIRIRDDGP